MQQIIDFIHVNYKNQSFSSVMVSESFKLNPAYLSRIFKEQVGVNLLTYVQTLRIKNAKELLQTTDIMKSLFLLHNMKILGGLGHQL